MAIQTPVIIKSEEDVLPALLENAEPFDKKDFTRLHSGVYVRNRAWSSKRSVSLRTDDGDIRYTREDRRNEIVNLHRVQQEELHRKLSKKFSVELEHGTFINILEAAYSDEGAEFRGNVLVPFWVYALELIGPDGVYHTIRNPQPEYKLVSGGKLLIPDPQHPAGIPYMDLCDDPIQRKVPTKTGYFNQFKGAIPVNN